MSSAPIPSLRSLEAMTTAEFAIKAMGSSAHVVVTNPPSGVDELVATRLEDLETIWSRYLPESDISRLNLAGGTAVEVATATITLISASVHAWQSTDGRFDPTILAVPSHSATGPGRATAPHTEPDVTDGSQHGCSGIVIDIARSSVSLPPGITFDPQGVGHGLAADLVVLDLLESGAEGAMVTVGRDTRAEGRPPRGDRWNVALQDPSDLTRTLATVKITGGGVSTSERATRLDDAFARHHLEPPGEDDRRGHACTAIAGAAWLAEAFAKAALDAGVNTGLDLVDTARMAALMVTSNGELQLSSRMSHYL